MTSYIAVGSNLDNRKKNIISAYNLLQKKGYTLTGVSPLYETPPALLYENAQEHWNIPYLNCIFRIETTVDSFQLLNDLKEIESSLKRGLHPKWSPRTIDLDIIKHNNIQLNTETLTIPHSLYLKRNFVLDPLSWFENIPFQNLYTLSHQPLIMGIVNVTPDSFSEKETSITKCKNKISHWIQKNIQIIDIGAEASNPNVLPIDEETEQNRLVDIFNQVSKYKENLCFSKFSIDTYHYKTAENALMNGFDIINDIHGFDEANMLSLAKEHKTKNFIFMHHNDIRSISLNKTILTIKEWIEKKREEFSKANIPLSQFIFDPGIGFGKSANQSLLILQHIQEFQDFGFRLLIGHSRKSFMNTFSAKKSQQRDLETLSLSLALKNNIDILRVHKPLEHLRAIKSFCYSLNQFY